MNAIIGMSTLAAQAIGDDDRVADCIAKIGISRANLLSLINDNPRHEPHREWQDGS